LFTFILPIIVVVSLYLATAGIVIGILVCFIAVGLSYRHIKKRKVIGEEEREVDEEDMTGDFESMKIVSKQNVPSRGGFSNVVIEVGEKSSATSSNSPDIPMGTDDSPREMAHGMSTHTAGNRLQSKPRKNRKEEDDISSVSSSDSDSSDSDSSSDESEAIKPPKSSRKKSKDVVMAMKARSGNKGSKKHRRDDSTAADSLAVVAEATSTNKRERLSKKQSESRSNEAGNNTNWMKSRQDTAAKSYKRKRKVQILTGVSTTLKKKNIQMERVEEESQKNRKRKNDPPFHPAKARDELLMGRLETSVIRQGRVEGILVMKGSRLQGRVGVE